MRFAKENLFLFALAIALASPALGQEVLFLEMTDDVAEPGAYQGTTFDGLGVTFVVNGETQFGDITGLLIDNTTGEITPEVTVTATGGGSFAGFANRDADQQLKPDPITAYGLRADDKPDFCFDPDHVGSSGDYKSSHSESAGGIVTKFWIGEEVYKYNPRSGRYSSTTSFKYYEFEKRSDGTYRYKKGYTSWGGGGGVTETGEANWP